MSPAFKRKKIVIGSRGSRLALRQSNFVKELLEREYKDLSVQIKIIKTTGDKIQKTPLSKIGGKALFLKEIEEKIADGTVDMGVHSLKDVPTDLPKGMAIGAVLKRADPRDAFVSHRYDSLLHLPKKAKLGTGSLRRGAQLKNFRPDFEIVPLRGNVETRVKKIATDKLDAVVLAAAGLLRLRMDSRITEYLPTSLMLPAVGQGAICIEVREGDPEIRKRIEFLNDVETVHCVQAERSFLKALGGDCQSPIAAYAEVNGQSLKLTGMVASVEGRTLIRDRVEGSVRDAVALGEQLAGMLLGHGAKDLLA